MSVKIMAKIDVRISILDNDVCMNWWWSKMRIMKFPNVQNAVNYTQISTTINYLNGRNIVNPKYIAIQIYMRVDAPWDTLLLKYGTT